MAKGNGHDDPRIASLDEARRRAAERQRAAKQGASRSGSESQTQRDWLIGGVFIAMAVAGIAWFAAKLLGVPL